MLRAVVIDRSSANSLVWFPFYLLNDFSPIRNPLAVWNWEIRNVSFFFVTSATSTHNEIQAHFRSNHVTVRFHIPCCPVIPLLIPWKVRFSIVASVVTIVWIWCLWNSSNQQPTFGWWWTHMKSGKLLCDLNWSSLNILRTHAIFRILLKTQHIICEQNVQLHAITWQVSLKLQKDPK